MKIVSVITAALAIAAAAPALGAEVEAKKDGVEVYVDATNKSDVVGKLKEGEALTAGERKGMFWEVKMKDGKAGFVSVLAVKHKAEGSDGLSKAIKSVVKEGRQTDETSESRARSAVMGVRGLREDDSSANAGNVRPDLRAVYRMEDTQSDKKKIEALGEQVFEEIAQKSGM